MKRTLMVDGDILLFTIGRITEDISDFGDEVLESFDKESCKRHIELELDKICEKTGYSREEIVFCISSKSNFRKRFFPTYKSNRKNVKKPLGLSWMVEYLLENAEKYNTMCLEELEADDVMGMYGTAPVEVSGSEIAIYSQDKDLKTVPCKQWDFKLKKFVHPTPMESTRYLYTQVLTGDAVDGYIGCPKVGKVKANKALLECESELEMLEASHKLFYKVYKEEAKQKLLEQMGQARILHFPDSQLLMQYDMLYNPYEMMGVSDELLQVWEEESRRVNKSNRVRQRKVGS